MAGPPELLGRLSRSEPVLSGRSIGKPSFPLQQPHSPTVFVLEPSIDFDRMRSCTVSQLRVEFRPCGSPD